MKTINTLSAFGLGLSLMFSTLAYAENHKAEATQHAIAAEESAKKGDTAQAAEHATTAKTHAEAAKAEKANPHLDAGIKNLDETIVHAKAGHAPMAAESANAAVAHLSAAEKSF
ncbi:MAG: hypothetical protein RLZ25_266 [Pseudomonadota bacterium]|jgi:hypothetical protein